MKTITYTYIFLISLFSCSEDIENHRLDLSEKDISTKSATIDEVNILYSTKPIADEPITSYVREWPMQLLISQKKIKMLSN